MIYIRGVGRWFDKGGLYRSISKGSVISVHKSYITIQKHRGHQPGAPMVPTPMHIHVIQGGYMYALSGAYNPGTILHLLYMCIHV
jgi:hypothetical protein